MSAQPLNLGAVRGYDSVQAPPVEPVSSLKKMRSLPWGEKDGGGSSVEKHVASFISTRRQGIALGLESYMSWLNVLLIFVPLGIIAGMLGWSVSLVFTFNFLAILPLAMILGKATEDIASHTNDTVGGLLNATFGNAVELIMSINALRAGLLDIIKATLIGSILSNLLLVLGMSLLFGGCVFFEQKVNPVVSEANAGLLVMASFGFMIPTVYAVTMSKAETALNFDEPVSLVVALIMLVLYVAYLVFQLITHSTMYDGMEAEEEEEERDSNAPSLITALVVLMISVLLVAINSDYLVDSVEGFSARLGLGKTFVSLMLLPLVGNAAEHMSAVTVAMKDKMDLSIGIACGSSVQIAAFVGPMMVVLSWLLGYQHLTLNFHILETVCVFMAVYIVNTMLRDFSTNWLEGALLVAGYLMVAAAFWYRI